MGTLPRLHSHTTVYGTNLTIYWLVYQRFYCFGSLPTNNNFYQHLFEAKYFAYNNVRPISALITPPLRCQRIRLRLRHDCVLPGLYCDHYLVTLIQGQPQYLDLQDNLQNIIKSKQGRVEIQLDYHCYSFNLICARQTDITH